MWFQVKSILYFPCIIHHLALTFLSESPVCRSSVNPSPKSWTSHFPRQWPKISLSHTISRPRKRHLSFPKFLNCQSLYEPSSLDIMVLHLVAPYCNTQSSAWPGRVFCWGSRSTACTALGRRADPRTAWWFRSALAWPLSAGTGSPASLRWLPQSCRWYSQCQTLITLYNHPRVWLPYFLNKSFIWIKLIFFVCILHPPTSISHFPFFLHLAFLVSSLCLVVLTTLFLMPNPVSNCVPRSFICHLNGCWHQSIQRYCALW